MAPLCGGISHTVSHWVEALLQISAGFWGNALQQGDSLSFPVSFLMQFLQADEAGKSLHLRAVQ